MTYLHKSTSVKTDRGTMPVSSVLPTDAVYDMNDNRINIESELQHTTSAEHYNIRLATGEMFTVMAGAELYKSDGSVLNIGSVDPSVPQYIAYKDSWNNEMHEVAIETELAGFLFPDEFYQLNVGDNFYTIRFENSDKRVFVR